MVMMSGRSVFIGSAMVMLLAACVHATGGSQPTGSSPLALADGDRVALVGNTFIERENQRGLIELALTLAHPDKRITFRNLGWSGDTVWGEARSYFGPPADGYKHLLQYVELVKPSVVFVNYGFNESFAGEPGLGRFLDQYNRLLDDLAKRTQRIVVLSPLPMEKLGAPLPDPAAANENIARYTEAIRQLAAKRGHAFIDLYTLMKPRLEETGTQLTNDGVHLNAEGYAVVANILAEQIAGLRVALSPSHEPLREAIVAKNELFFHRFRPQNETYLRGFRKHEQGNNAVEIERFDPLVEQADEKISKLRQAAATEGGR